MSHIINANREFNQKALINMQGYHKLYRQSIEHPNEFWAEQAERLTWHRKWDQVQSVSFHKPISIQWFEGGMLNVSYNCIDRHLAKNAQKTAFLFESDSAEVPTRKITYQNLHDEVCKYANALKKSGVQKGDRVTIYMPMIPETTFAMLACTRIGAIHSVVFGGFSPDSIADRIKDCDSTWVITADEGLRGGKKIPLKANMDAALEKVSGVKKVFVVKHSGGPVHMKAERDFWMHQETENLSPQCDPVWMNAEDPLFILYTSGSTGKPKGVVHTTAGYLLWANMTFHYVFDHRPEDVFWCTADVGWVTGHSYVVYGSLSNAATSVMFEGIPNYPDHSRFWQIIDKNQVSIFYTAPTAIRALMREGDQWVKKTSRKSLRLLGSVGEPINPEAWLWYYNTVGDARCPIVDTWWQTETGGIMIAPLPGAFDLKPGSATLPFFGVYPSRSTCNRFNLREFFFFSFLIVIGTKLASQL